MVRMNWRAQTTKERPMGYKYDGGIPVPIYTAAEMKAPLREILLKRSKTEPIETKSD